MLAEALDKLKSLAIQSSQLQQITDGHKTLWCKDGENVAITEDRDSKRRILFESLPAFAAAVAECGNEASEVIPTSYSDFGWECELEDSILKFQVLRSQQMAFWASEQQSGHKDFILNCRKHGGIAAADMNALQTLNARATSSAEFKQGRDKGVSEFVVRAANGRHGRNVGQGWPLGSAA